MGRPESNALSPEEIRRTALATLHHFPVMDQKRLDKEFADLRKEWDRLDRPHPAPDFSFADVSHP
ncbi:MAG: hypothetical protein HQL76_11090 [Magnetococcales bacterium]|nr:hypothetical protein [Magnetococcales bacterium]